MATDREILNSWKEIANHIGRGIRTVQRWERYFHLPVHRPSGHGRSSVVAFSDEIDNWLNSTPVRNGRPAAGAVSVPRQTRRLTELVSRSARALADSAERLQSSMLRLHHQQQRRWERAKKQEIA